MANALPPLLLLPGQMNDESIWRHQFAHLGEVCAPRYVSLLKQDSIVALAKHALGWDASEAGIAERQGRIFEPEEVAEAALFLASGAAPFVNGVALFVDNGWKAAS